jgi:serine/threonine protein phosphatase PrpC
MIVAMDATTGSLLVAVFDGHGQNGHKVCVCAGDICDSHALTPCVARPGVRVHVDVLSSPIVSG